MKAPGVWGGLWTGRVVEEESSLIGRAARCRMPLLRQPRARTTKFGLERCNVLSPTHDIVISTAVRCG